MISRKTESTIVLAILQSKSQVVSSHTRRTDIAFEVVFGPRLRRDLRPCSGLAPLRCARTLQLANKQAIRRANRKKRK